MNILIVNEHSALNLGDDAIMQVTLNAVKAAFPDARVTLLANDPDSWLRYQDITVLGSFTTWMVDRDQNRWRWRPFPVVWYLVLIGICAAVFRATGYCLRVGTPHAQAVLDAYYSADLVLGCGGGVLYAYSPVSLAYLLALLHLAFAKTLAKRVVMLPQSVGPVAGMLQKYLTRRLLEEVDCVMLRERYSLQFVQSLGTTAVPALVPDLAFGLPATRDGIGNDCARSQSISIGVTVIDRGAQNRLFTQQKNYEDSIVALLQRLHSRYNAHIHLFSQCTGPTRDQDDRLCTRRVYKRLFDTVDSVTMHAPYSDAMRLKEAFRGLDLMIGSRAHTAVFALGSEVPVLLIGYQPKARGFMSLFDLERYCCSIDETTADEMYCLACELIDNRKEICTQISKALGHIKADLSHWIDYLWETT